MPPEVYGALSLAAKWCGHSCEGKGSYNRKRKRKRVIDKVQKHIARAMKYQSKRECP